MPGVEGTSKEGDTATLSLPLNFLASTVQWMRTMPPSSLTVRTSVCCCCGASPLRARTNACVLGDVGVPAASIMVSPDTPLISSERSRAKKLPTETHTAEAMFPSKGFLASSGGGGGAAKATWAATASRISVSAARSHGSNPAPKGSAEVAQPAGFARKSSAPQGSVPPNAASGVPEGSNPGGQALPKSKVACTSVGPQNAAPGIPPQTPAAPRLSCRLSAVSAASAGGGGGGIGPLAPPRSTLPTTLSAARESFAGSVLARLSSGMARPA
mmetsp:Transcript_16305/g.34426  ORF Transcript_16305/g.34426 Transcript_16305/m.34426 type:complete len:271 (+) Transcript_16305:517-1329(+)